MRSVFLAPTMILMLAVWWSPRQAAEAEGPLRLATYNASLHGTAAGEIGDRLQDGVDQQAEKVAAIVQAVQPDVLLVNEIDYDEAANTASLLANKFFARRQRDRDAIVFPYVYPVPSNTGIDSGFDLNRNGTRGEPADAWGYGQYPGQYGMAVFSKHPILEDEVRTFQGFHWKDMPAAKQPIDPATGMPYYAEGPWNALRLSSKNHVDIPLRVGPRIVHLLISHPTPPVFDGQEDRNGCRNHDEVRFWIDYLSVDERQAEFIVDDRGRRGGLTQDAWVVLMGDLNVDAADGDGDRRIIRRLLGHPRLQDPRPARWGDAPSRTGDVGDAKLDTASFRHADMRVDYVLPDRRFRVRDAGVFWPPPGDPQQELISASDHRLVWVTVEFP